MLLLSLFDFNFDCLPAVLAVSYNAEVFPLANISHGVGTQILRQDISLAGVKQVLIGTDTAFYGYSNFELPSLLANFFRCLDGGAIFPWRIGGCQSEARCHT